jgi:uncharacterized membrane protein YhaH (DUF805 family)
MKRWFYFAKGAVVGPLTEGELLLAVERGDVDLKTLVYTPEFGAAPENWKQLGNTELASKAYSAAAPLLAAPMTLAQKLFSFRGRLNRAAYIGLTLLCAAAVGVGIRIAIGIGASGHGSRGPIIIAVSLAIPLMIVGYWAGAALCAKKLHDLNLSGAHVIWIYLFGIGASAITFLAPVWITVLFYIADVGILLWLWCTPGTNGPNCYGPPRVYIAGVAFRASA